MLAELVISYMIQSNVPAYTITAEQPYVNAIIQLKTHEDFGSLFYGDLDPYIWWTSKPARVGVQADVGVKLGEYLRLEAFHESYHNVDEYGTGQWMSGVRMRWRLW